jgi:hypothetical protein
MEVVLKKPHEHAGTLHASGKQIDVDAVTAAWLYRHGVIDRPVAERPRRERNFNRRGEEE